MPLGRNGKRYSFTVRHAAAIDYSTNWINTSAMTWHWLFKYFHFSTNLWSLCPTFLLNSISIIMFFSPKLDWKPFSPDLERQCLGERDQEWAGEPPQEYQQHEVLIFWYFSSSETWGICFVLCVSLFCRRVLDRVVKKVKLALKKESVTWVSLFDRNLDHLDCNAAEY